MALLSAAAVVAIAFPPIDTYPALASTVVDPVVDFGDYELRFECPISGTTEFRLRPEDVPSEATGIVTAKPGFPDRCDGGISGDPSSAVRARGVVASDGSLTPQSWDMTNSFGGVRMDVDRWVEFGNGSDALTIIYSAREPATFSLDPATQTLTGTSTNPVTPTSVLTAIGFSQAPSFSAPDLPAGLSIDASTGVISGTPTAPFGPQDVTITAENDGEVATAAVGITISTPQFVVTLKQDIGMETRTISVDQGQPLDLPKTQNGSGQVGVTLTGRGSTLFPIVKDSHFFGGWYTDEALGEASFVGLPGTSYLPSADITLHAKWIPARDICFQQVDNTVDSAVTFPSDWTDQWPWDYPITQCAGTTRGTQVRVPSGVPFDLPVPTRSNAGFHGWFSGSQPTSTSSPSGTLYGRGGETHQVTFSSGSVLTYHSQWQTAALPINFDANLFAASWGSEPCQLIGTSNPPQCRISWNPGDPLAPSGRPTVTAPTPVREGWRFDGWFTSSSGGTRLGGGGDPIAEVSGSTARGQWTQLALNRSSTSMALTAGAAITPWTVTPVAFTPTTFTVSPALPSGLAIDASDGTISGTPTVPQAATTHTITATGTDGPVTTTLSISVAVPPLGAPVGLAATPGDAQVTLSWQPPADTSGPTITSYTVTADPGGATCTTAALTCTITGLTNGSTYGFTVVAQRAEGSGTVSNTVSGTPVAAPAVAGPVPPTTPTPAPVAANWVPTPANEQPRKGPAAAEMQREGGPPVALAALSSAAGEVAYVDDEGSLSIVFTGDTATSVERGLVATREGMVRCEICAAIAEGTLVEIWTFSTPRLVATAVADANGCIDTMIPLSAPLDGGPAIGAGQHTLQVVLPMDDGSGRLAVNVGVIVGGLAPSGLPAGEGSTTDATAAGLMLLLTSAGLHGLLRRSGQSRGRSARPTVGASRREAITT